jgi:predicted TIM-barrel fold metal-dependent hydrolase
MDMDGVTAEVIFAGAQNGHLWNSWLADFCSVASERLLGVMQIPIWDVERSIDEIRWGASHGLRAINFAAPRPDYPAYNEDVYEPLWAAVEEVGLPLVTHCASGELGSGLKGRGSMLVWLSEVLWLSRRGLGQMIFGGVFDRHPALRVMFVEQRGNWIQQALEELDSACIGAPRNSAMPLLGAVVEVPRRLPSEYWATNCAVIDSFMAPFEAQARHEIGLETLMWGSDYPHIEGTWPRTELALRNTFSDVPETDVRMILEKNPVRFFGLDTAILRPIADRIGPAPQKLSRALSADEVPAYRGLAFREVGAFH